MQTAENESQKTAGLALYGFPSCPYCRRVLGAIDAMGLEIPLRNTMSDGAYHDEIYAALGRGTVPVLRIEGKGGKVQWLPESADIIQYLEERFGA
ncbi:MAG: glutathione S-transferase N-terminal domain-containing protein [Myxococcota bacterium]